MRLLINILITSFVKRNRVSSKRCIFAPFGNGDEMGVVRSLSTSTLIKQSVCRLVNTQDKNNSSDFREHLFLVR